MKYILSILTIIVFSAFAKAQQDTTQVPTPKIVFKAKYGEVVKKGNVSLKLDSILEDSRCPSDVECIWAGQVKLLVEVTKNGKKETKEIIFKDNAKSEVFKDKTDTIYIKSIMPRPTSTGKQDLGSYVLLLEKLG